MSYSPISSELPNEWRQWFVEAAIKYNAKYIFFWDEKIDEEATAKAVEAGLDTVILKR